MTSTKSLTKIAAVVLAVVLALCATLLSGCSNDSNSEDKTITVAAVPTPHAEILNEVVAPALKDKGYTLEVKEFTDYVQPNTVTEEGEVDANYFQHGPYLEDFNAQNDTHLVSVASVHYEPFGLYSTKHTDVSQIPDGGIIAVPNDTTNEARALLLLEQEGLIKLNPDAGVTATINDIVENPKNLQFHELEAAVVPTVIDDVDAAAVNANYALEGNLMDKQIAVEDPNGLAAQTYSNLIVVKEGNENLDKIKALVEVINSDQVRDYIIENYNGAVVPSF